MRAVITGATGFIGRQLVKALEDPVVLSRDPARARSSLGVREAHAWEPMSGPPPKEAFERVQAVFHLAGESVGEGRWNAEKKRKILDSRVIGTRKLVETLGSIAARPAVLVSCSAVGYYGSRGDETLTERSSPGDDFLADVCKQWEAESQSAAALGIRVVNPRLGIVLGPDGGALQKMLFPFKLGIGGRLGDGRQWMPWIHLDDVVGLLLHAAGAAEVAGPMNAVSPNPVSNRDFTATLGRVLHRPTVLPMPAFALRLAVGEFSEVLVSSQRAVPSVAEQTGYRFQYPELEAGLRSCV